jgi:hypothetical protein
LSEPEGFLSRWSRRKRALRDEAEAAPAPVAEAAPALEPVAEAAPAPEPEPIDLPPLESLTQESDFRVFLRAGVPDAVRHAALRRLWSLDPAIRDFTNPLDYGWDFNAPDGGMAGFSNTLTGDIAKLLRQAIGAVDDAARDAEEAPPAPPAEAGPEPPWLAGPAPEFIPPAFAPPAGPEPQAPDEPEPPRRRHGGAVPA